MNNFELHERATTLSDRFSSYALAKMLLSAVESEVDLLDNGCGNDLDFDNNLACYTETQEGKEAGYD